LLYDDEAIRTFIVTCLMQVADTCGHDFRCHCDFIEERWSHILVNRSNNIRNPGRSGESIMPPPCLRVGAVSYLNTKPLVHRLTERISWIDLKFDVPSRLATGLQRAEYDVALIPSIEYFQRPDYTIVSDACIGCRGPVWSVKLYSRCPVSKIRTLALDEGSRTSVALVRILLQDKYALAPELKPFPLGDDPCDTNTDAVLVIGDRAMEDRQTDFAEVWDLGDQWYQHTQLPFVFAMWVARPGVDTRELATELSAVCDFGIEELASIAQREAPRYGLSYEKCLRYLRDNLNFFLGTDERRGLAEFYRNAMSLNLAPAGANLESDDQKTISQNS